MTRIALIAKLAEIGVSVIQVDLVQDFNINLYNFGAETRAIFTTFIQQIKSL